MNKKERNVLIISFLIIAVITATIIGYLLFFANKNNDINMPETSENASENVEVSKDGNISSEKSKDKPGEESAPQVSPKQENTEQENSTTPAPETDSSTPEQTQDSPPTVGNMNLGGIWYAAGRDDHVQSTWNFDNGDLIVNGKYRHKYSVAPHLDKNGFAQIYIDNLDGTRHVLLVKPTQYGMDGITAEGADYEKYMYDQTAPLHNQIIEFRK